MRDRLSAVLSDRYVLERELGRGGMATVYLARDLRHRREVALKVLDPQLAHALGPERFRREIDIAAGLQHPHILTVFDSGESDGILWYTMPFVDGETLRDRLSRTRELPIDVVMTLIREIADALDTAHARGVIHRDIKPENILLAKGHALVTDFGIAHAIDQGAGRLTATGLAIGTPAYMSPEQAAGDRNVEASSDVYSLACMAFEMLVGEPPYTGASSHAIMTKRVTDPIPSARRLRAAVPVAADLAIRRALSPTPADRYSSAGAFAEALARSSVAPRPTRRILAIAALGLLGVVLATMLVRRPAANRTSSVNPHLVKGNALVAKRTPAAASEAITEYQAVLADEPENAAALAKVGYTYALFGDWGWAHEGRTAAELHAMAIDYAARAIAADSTSADAWLTRGYVLTVDDPYRMRGAVEAFDRALAIDSTMAEGWYQLGQTLMALGNDTRAADAYRRAFALDHNRPLALMSLSAMLLQAGRVEEARRVVDSAVTASRTASSPYVRVVRGLIELSGGDVRSAHDDADLALAMDTNYTIPARTLLVRVLMAEGNRARAGAEVTRIVAEVGTGSLSPTTARFASSALLAVGRTSEAIDLIERARPRGAQLWFYLHGLEFQPLHSDPRFEQVYRQADPAANRN